VSRSFDVVVVGAGLGGAVAALTVARAGRSVAIVERGRRPGSKNAIGGVLYTPVLDRLLPDFAATAPLERHVVARSFSFLTSDSQVSFEVRSAAFDAPPRFNQAFTVRRTAFDPWLVDQARAAGATLVPSTVVESLLHEGGDPKRPVAGVLCGREGGEIGAKIVIVAEGAHALLAEREGLRPRATSDELLLGVKEVLALDRGILEDRFALEGNCGRAFEFFGDPAKGGFGSGFLYTNADSLSVGLSISLSHLARTRTTPAELLDRFKSHPSVRPLLRGAEPVEYCAHLLPTGSDAPVRARDGVLLVGDAARLANLSHYKEITNLVTASGEAAGEAAVEALASGDATVAALAGYERRLHAGFVLRDLRKFERIAGLLERSPALLERYPRLLVRSLVEHFRVSERPKDEVERDILRAWNREAKPAELRRDLVNVLEAMGFSLAPLLRKMMAPALRPGGEWLRALWLWRSARSSRKP
jgi:electron transfer flavoprotein-quinone oxidoreductase